ncbi:putative Glyoxalase/bleomycin resistance protein/dioxygenase [Streptomyces sp. Tu6071]|nr:putative Glyoxalase/bleomycin resistance protein/dioxygenase [Streptomyces sp. Tu6071]
MDPHLVLEGVAAGRVVLLERGEPGVFEPGGGGGDLVGALHLNTEVVQAGDLARLALDEDELERRRGDGEVRVSGAALGGLDAEHLGVEGDRCFEVGDVERELDTGHSSLLDQVALMSVDATLRPE